MPNQRPLAIHVVYAEWCPHCVPTTVEPMMRAAKELRIRYVPHDIDTAEEQKADDLVKEYGDWTDDYLVPQVFLEFDGGKMVHVLTGNPSGIDFTRRAVEALLESEWLRKE
jgi:glutaredoxin